MITNLLLFSVLVVVIISTLFFSFRIFREEWKEKNYICAILESMMIIFASSLFCIIFFFVVNIENIYK